MSTIDELCRELVSLHRLEQEGKDMRVLIAEVQRRLQEKLDKIKREDRDGQDRGDD